MTCLNLLDSCDLVGINHHVNLKTRQILSSDISAVPGCESPEGPPLLQCQRTSYSFGRAHGCRSRHCTTAILSLLTTYNLQSSNVRNLGIIFDKFLSFYYYISSVCRCTHFHLRNICKIRHLLSPNAAAYPCSHFDSS